MPSAATRHASRAFRLRAALCVLLAAGAAAASGCGKKGPPLPPVRILPRPAQNVHVRQLGPDIVIEATLSLSRTDGSPLGPGAAVHVMKMRPAPTLKPGGVSVRYLMLVFQKEAKVAVSLSGAELQRATASGRLVYLDRAAADVGTGAVPGAPGPRYLYSVQIVDERGERSPPSVPQEIQVAPPPKAPVGLVATAAEGEVRLSWESGEPGTTKELFNVYRRAAAEEDVPLQPLNLAPIPDRTYVDTKFQYGETYRYSVRALLTPPPPMRESAPSAEVEVRPLDVYSPKAPTGLAAAVEGQAIKLYWFPNSEPDLRSYRIYRRQEGEEFRQIGEVDAAETSFADTTAARGVRYHYAVSAVDGATPPNESARSEEVSEGLPADASG